jgi:hypothetical protein
MEYWLAMSYTEKGDELECKNYTGTAFLNIAYTDLSII